MLGVSWPDDWITALAILIFILIVLWWRHRYPTRYDVTLRMKHDPEREEAPDQQD